MTGPTQVSEGSTRSEANEPWDERPSVVNHSSMPAKNNETNMRVDRYQNEEEEELEDGDLPRLNLSRSASNGKDPNPLVGRNASHVSQKSIHHENLQKMAGGSEELKKQQAFWKQLDTASTKTSFEDEDADGRPYGKKKRFDKSRMGESQQPTEDREDTKVKQGPSSRKNDGKSRGSKVDAAGEIRRAESDESDDTRDSKEYLVAEHEDNNFCDNTLSAMEAICGDSGLQEFCGGPNNGSSNPPVRRRKAKNLNILNARGDNDSVDEHTAIEVEYVEPEETNGLYQEKPENWSPTRKNAYLAAMARKAKEDFEKSQTKEIPPASPRRQAGPGSVASEEESAAQDVYNSFNAAEKRKFLRLINSGMTPTESAERVRAEREKSKETKPSKKGKLFKFWKKGKAKTEKPSEKEFKASHPPSDRDQEGFPLESGYPQEEKKDDEQLTPGNVAVQSRLQEPQRDNASQSTTSSSEKSGEGSQDSQSKSQSPSKASSADNNHGLSGSESAASTPKKAENQDIGGSSRESTSDSSSVRANARAQEEKVHLSPERPEAFAQSKDAISPIESPRNVSTSLGLKENAQSSSPFDGGFAKSGINYYDAVRREVSESEDETEFSNQVSIASKGSRLNKGPRLGPILHSPKMKGFSKLSRNGFKDDHNISEDAPRKLELQLKTERAAEGGQVETQAPTQSASPRSSALSSNRNGQNTKMQLSGKEKSQIPDKDFSSTDNVQEYGSANFDIPARNSNSTVNTESNSPSKAEEEALERIEKELLRPVRNGDGSIPIKTKEYSSAQTTTPRSQKSADKLRDQIVAVVSPEGVVSPMTQASSLRTPQEKTSFSTHEESSPSPKPIDASLFQASPMASNMPAVVNPSPASSSQHLPKEPIQVGSKGPSLEPTQEDLDFGMQEYLNSTEVYSQAGHVNDSMSIVSGKSYTTHDTGMQGSVYTQGSTLTQSSRKRRPGAAKIRLAKAKEAERQALKKKGWHESIQAAAESTNRVWKPNVGWVDYLDTSMESNAADLSARNFSTEKIHLNLPVVGKTKRQQGSETGQPINLEQDSQQQQKSVEDEEHERKASSDALPHEYSSEQGSPSLEPATPSNGSALQGKTGISRSGDPQRPPSKGAAVQTEISSATLDESFLAVPPPPPTTNQATNTRDPTWYQPEPPAMQNHVTNVESSVKSPTPLSLDDMSIEESIAHSVDQFVKSVAATSPTRSSRTKPSTSPNSRLSPSRANRFSNSPSKRTGWVDSMRAATANIDKEGKSWDPVHGWNVDASEPARSSVNDDFSPPSTRFGQETIDERQGEASDRFDSARSDCTGPEPADRSEPDQDDDQSDVEESDDKMLESDGAFPVERFNTTTVHVIKEKVDEEEMHWFPPTRRSSSMVVIAEDPNENASSAASSSKIRSSHVHDDDAPDGVIWDGVVFETGSFSPSRPKPSMEKKSSNTYSGAGNTNSTAEKVSNTEVSKSGSSVSSKSSFSKPVPRLSQNKRDTSPIRGKRATQKFESRSERDASRDVPRTTDQNFWTHEAPAADDQKQSAPDTWKSSVSEKSSTISEGEQARAKRSVWRSAASPSNSPRRRGNQDNQVNGFDAAPSDNRASMPTEPTESEDRFVGQAKRYYTTSDDYKGEHSEDAAAYSYYGTPLDQEDSEPFAESANVRARAQFWESRTPSRDAENDAEDPRHPDNPNRLNSATAEWKSFLGKKVRAETVAAAGQHGNQIELADGRGRSFGDRSDSLFDFSVDSRGRNHHDAGGVRFSQGHSEEDRTGQRRFHADERDSVDASNADGNAAPSEISEYSDGNEINKPFLQRLAGCAAPMMAKRNQASDTLAHLAFLRTNGNDGNHGRFMPHLCGRPEVILEEAEEKKMPENNETGRELSYEKSRAIQSKGNEVRADTRSVISEDFGAKTAYLEALAMKTAVSKPRRSSSRGRERSSTASEVSSASSKEQKERWRNLLERKKAGASPAKSRASESEAVAAKKVDEMLASMMASRSKSAPRSRRVTDDLNGGRSCTFEKEQTTDGQYKSESLVAAEQLASVRLNAMMEALAHGDSGMEEGEI